MHKKAFLESNFGLDSLCLLKDEPCLQKEEKTKKLKQEVIMTFDKSETKKLSLNPDESAENSSESEQALVEALERYLRLSSLTLAHPLPRWVMW